MPKKFFILSKTLHLKHILIFIYLALFSNVLLVLDGVLGGLGDLRLLLLTARLGRDGVDLVRDVVDLLADDLVDGVGGLHKEVGEAHEEVEGGDEGRAEVELCVVDKVDDVVEVDDDDEDQVGDGLGEELVPDNVGGIGSDEIEEVKCNRHLEGTIK